MTEGSKRARAEMAAGHLSRRGFLTAGAAGVAGVSLSACSDGTGQDDAPATQSPIATPAGLEDADWADIRARFILEPGTAYMNNASLGMPPASVGAAVGAGYEALSREPLHGKHELGDVIATRVVPGLATFLGADPEEIVLTRNTPAYHPPGTSPLPTRAALAASHDFMEAVGIENVAARTRHLSDQLKSRLASLSGVTMLSGPTPTTSCPGSTIFELEGVDAIAAVPLVEERAKIHIDEHQRDGHNAIRISTHVYHRSCPMSPSPSLKTALILALPLAACDIQPIPEDAQPTSTDAQPTPEYTLPIPEPDFTLGTENTHNRWSAVIPPVLTVPSGAVVEVHTKEASDGQITESTTADDLANIDFGLIHALTGPIHVEGASPGDVLAVTIHEVEVSGWGWATILPGFGFLADEFTEPWIRGFPMEPGATEVRFNDDITLPLAPFAGVLGVAPATDSMLVTIPPRTNGGNMDNRHMTAGTTVYLPVQVEGALFSIGDTHAAQGDGEVSGTAIEAPMRIVLTLEVVENTRGMVEPQYETGDYYAVTGFATTIDEAARKATRYMIDYLVAEHGLTPEEAYVLCSLAGDLKISETVDVPHMLVSMHMPKGIFGG